MSSPSSSDTTINVKVLSQLPEPEHIRLLEALPVTMTVEGLKTRLSRETSSIPSPDHMRLIYSGRLLARDEATLEEVFAHSAAQQGGTYTIHMVLRDNQRPSRDQNSTPPSQSNPRNGSNQGHRFRPDQAPPIPPFNANSGGIPPGFPTTVPPSFMFNGQQGASVQSQTPFHTLQGGSFQQNPVFPPQLPSQHNINGIMQMHVQQIQAQQRHMAQMQQQAQRPNQTSVSSSTTQDRNSRAATPNQGSQGSDHSASRNRTSSDNNTVPNGPTPPGFPSNMTDHGTSQGPQQQSPQMPNPNGNMTFRETVGPNGQRFMMAFGSTNMPVNMPGIPSNMLHNGMMPPLFQNMNFGPNGGHPNGGGQNQRFMSDWPGMPLLGATSEYFGEAHALDSMRQYQRDLDDAHGRLRDHFNENLSPNPHLASGFHFQVQGIIRGRNRAQEMLNRLIIPGEIQYHQGLSAETVNALQVLNETFARRAREVLQGIRSLQDANSSLQPRGASRVNATESQAPSSTSQTPMHHDNRNASVRPITTYLLNSPSGPHAVVFTPQGIFSNSAMTTTSTVDARRQGQANVSGNTDSLDATLARSRINSDRITRAYQTLNEVNRDIESMEQSLANIRNQVRQQGSNQQPNQRAQPRPDDQRALAQVVDQLQNVQQQVDQRQAQARNEANADLLPLIQQAFRHLWLMIRVFGCIWLFTRGASTRRAVLVLISTMIYLLIQAGVFGERPLERLRHWFEQIVGVENEGRRHQQQQPLRDQQGQQPERRQEGGTAPNQVNQIQRQGDPVTPEALAERLLRERQNQDRSWFRVRFAGIERSMALFLASLYPGVGERHIAARERAAREAREIEERRRREEAERLATVEEQGQEPPAQSIDPVSNETRDKGKARASADTAVGASSSVAAAPEGELRGRGGSTQT